MEDPQTIIEAFLGADAGATKERLRQLGEMDSALWSELGVRFQNLLRAKTLPASWENEEGSSLALLLLLALRWRQTRSDSLRTNVGLDGEEALGRMLDRGYFRRLSAAHAALLGLATEMLAPEMRSRVPALRESAREAKEAREARAAGDIALSPRLRTQLFRLREALQPSAPTTLLLADVVAAESALRLTLPSSLLGLMAVLGTTPETIVELTTELRRDHDLPELIVATGQRTIDLGGYFMPICASCSEDGRADLVFAWDYKRGRASSYRVGDRAAGSDLSTFLTWRWGRYQTLPNGAPPYDLSTPNVDLDLAVDAREIAAFRPAIVDSEARKRVRHPKFGDGEVLTERDGKCTVVFASGTKTLLASTLVRVD